MIQKCPSCGNTGRIEAIHGMTRSMTCCRCGTAWASQINGSTSYDDVILLGFDGVLGQMTIMAGRRRVKLAAITRNAKDGDRRHEQDDQHEPDIARIRDLRILSG